jgi:DNA (cytosine-5)-methyltransferase 1
MLTFGSLFSGIGGFDLGLERAGMTPRWQVEIDPFCQRVLEKHWPDVVRYGDITQVDFKDVEPVDLVCGGFPCQPFSAASHGKGRGTDDHRWLWPEMLRSISTVRPSWVLAENVPHIDGPALESVVSDLEGIGYQVAPPLEIPACAFGFNHRRSRIWVCAYADGSSESSGSINAKAFELQGNSYHTPDLGSANGLPRRLDRSRLRSLGNAVVPGIVEWLGCQIVKSALMEIAA